MFAKPDSHTPSLSTFQTQGSPPSPHDYESLPSSFNQAFLSRMGSEDYTRIGPAPRSGATSPPWIPEGGKGYHRTAVLSSVPSNEVDN